MKTPDELRAAASRYRQLARSVTDERAVDALLKLADEYEKLAADSEHMKGHKSIAVDGGC